MGQSNAVLLLHNSLNKSVPYGNGPSQRRSLSHFLKHNNLCNRYKNKKNHSHCFQSNQKVFATNRFRWPVSSTQIIGAALDPYSLSFDPDIQTNSSKCKISNRLGGFVNCIAEVARTWPVVSSMVPPHTTYLKY